MIKVTNLIIHPKEIPFEQYQELEGFSFSDLKKLNGAPDFIPTEKMMLGTRVHNFLFEPKAYDWKDASVVKPLAIEVNKATGGAIKYMQTEASVTAKFWYEGFCMLYRGRIDAMRPKQLIFDLKVTEMNDIEKLIEFMGYDNQLGGYAIATGTPNAMICALLKKKGKCILRPIDVKKSETFWIEQILKYGEYVQN